AVRGRRVDATAVRTALAAVDDVDGRLGRALRTTDRWTTVRATVADRVSRTSWPQAATAYTQYSDLNTELLELNRTVGDNSRLILDPAIDAYYVTNATLLRIPEILVDSGRYADLSVLSAAGGPPDATAQAQLAAARNRIATDAADLADGLVKAFGRTGSSTLGPGLAGPLADFRTAVDAVAPSTSLLAPVPQRSLLDLAGDQATLQRAALALERATLSQLDLLLRSRVADAQRGRVVTLAAGVVGVLVAAGLAALVWRRFPAGPARARRSQPDRDGRSQPARAGPPQPTPPAEKSVAPVNGPAVPARAGRNGGARAAR
ncbi:MAG TPA: hypothetical protein VLM05_13255, partial [Mycobacteriales bacterium]|nr:hypothetical protein [Mycobacteriales bacterium]